MSEDNKIMWIKKGGGTFRMSSGKIIKQNQKFIASEEEIPKAFRDTVVPANPGDALDEDNEIKVDAEDPGYVIVDRSPGWYNIEDKDGKVMNESGLRKADAEKMLEDLQ